MIIRSILHLYDPLMFAVGPFGNPHIIGASIRGPAYFWYLKIINRTLWAQKNLDVAHAYNTAACKKPA